MRHILKIHRSLTDPLPTTAREYSIRTFDPAQDKDRWLQLNNKIFANHPDQGNWAIAAYFLRNNGDKREVPVLHSTPLSVEIFRFKLKATRS